MNTTSNSVDVLHLTSLLNLMGRARDMMFSPWEHRSIAPDGRMIENIMPPDGTVYEIRSGIETSECPLDRFHLMPADKLHMVYEMMKEACSGEEMTDDDGVSDYYIIVHLGWDNGVVRGAHFYFDTYDQMKLVFDAIHSIMTTPALSDMLRATRSGYDDAMNGYEFGRSYENTFNREAIDLAYRRGWFNGRKEKHG